MGTTRQHLEAWERAGLIDEATVARILAWEAEASTAVAPDEGQRPGFLESLVYLGVALVVVGVAVLAGSNWGHLGSWARLLITGIPAVLAVAAGSLLLKQGHAGIQRGGSMAWAASVALFGGTAGIAVNEAGGHSADAQLAAACTGVIAALVLWQQSKRALQVAAGAGAAFTLAMGITAQVGRTDSNTDQLVGGLAMVVMGLAAAAATEKGWISPRASCRVFAGLGIAFGALFTTFSGTGTALIDVIPLLAGGAMVAIGIRAGSLAYLGFGVAAIFAGTIVLITRRVDDPTVAALALMVVGVALIGVVLTLAKLKPWQGERMPPPASSSA